MVTRIGSAALMKFRSLFRRRKVEHDLDRELSFHLQEQIRENNELGMTPEEARAAALRVFGGVPQIQEECRDQRGTDRVETLWMDTRYALRGLRRAPGFTTVIVLTMALSIGANSAIFSLIEGVLLRPLPYPHPERMVRLFFKSENYAKFPLNPFDLRDFRDRNRSFEALAGMTRSDAQLSTGGEPVKLHGFAVTAGYFGVLGFKPARGREFTRNDELPDHAHSVVISDSLWKRRFGGDPRIIGRALTLDAERYTVVGVMPPDLQHPGNEYHAVPAGQIVDVWRPFVFDGDPNQRGSHFMDGIARLKPGVSVERGAADLANVLAQLGREHPGDRGWSIYAVPLYRETVGRSERMLSVLLAAVALLLLIACVNAANLLLARSGARRREIAVRAAVGAARSRIVRLLLTESTVIALAGGLLGTALAIEGVRVLVALLPAGFPRASSIHLDPVLFLFTLAVALLTGLLFGLVPALGASRADLQESLRDGGRTATAGRSHHRLRSALVVAETGVACLLLIGAGLLLHSFVNLLRSDPGFQPDRVLTATIALPDRQYKDIEQKGRFYSQLRSDLEHIPGVQVAGVGSDLPWTGYDENAGFAVEGRSDAYNDKTTARYHFASPGYFDALGIPLLRGRFFTDHDDTKSPRVMIVNRAMERTYWPGENAVGKRITFSDHPKESDWFNIVGVTGDVLDQPNSPAPHPAFWWALNQMPFYPGELSVLIRTKEDPSRLAPAFRASVARLNPGLAVADLRQLKEIASQSVSTQRFALFLVALFAALALILAAIGIYGVLSYSVNQRMPEFGMRVALGAGRADLMRIILGQGLGLAAAGTAIGVVLGLALTRLLASLLYGVKPADPLTLTAVTVLTLITAGVACYLPARRATAADPMHSLRAE